MRTIALIAALALAGCAHHVHVAKPPPPQRMSPATSSAVITGEPRATDGDPGVTQTTEAEIRTAQPKPAPRPPGQEP